jgi:hypothetical protein
MGFFHSLELVSTTKQDARRKRQLQWEDRPVRPGISINNHADYGNKTTKKKNKLSTWVFPSLPQRTALTQMDCTEATHNKPGHSGMNRSHMGVDRKTNYECILRGKRLSA